MDLPTTWKHFYDTYDHRAIEVFGGLGIQLLFFWIPATLIVLTEHFFPAFSLSHKMQPGRNQPDQILVAARTSMANQLLLLSVHAVIVYGLGVSLLPIDPILPSLGRFAADFAFGLIFREILFYYVHRLFHHPKLYPWIHKKHHRFTVPIAYAATYCTFTEHVLANTIPVVLPHTLLNAHVVSRWAFVGYEIFQSVIDHSGFYFTIWPAGRAHDYHHEKFRVCYGTIGLLDWLHGTDEMPLKKRKEG